ncbi:RNA polymerase sigma factor [Mycolicibacterium thermoresistibile]
MEAATIVAGLTRAVGDVGMAEDLAQEALVDALTQWPRDGVPRNPGGWLTTVAKRKAIDHWRRQNNLDAKYAALARDLDTRVDDDWDPDRIDDDILRLIFIAAHPVLSRQNQIALTLRVVGGLTTDEISRALLVGKATVAALVADEPEVHGLVALMEFQSSRFAARTDPHGAAVLLEDQDRTRWNRAQIHRGVTALQRAARAVGRRGSGWGRYALQAALAECHAVAPTAADTDWSRIVMLYDGLRQIAPSPVVELNRAIAVAMASGPAAGLRIVDELTGLPESHLVPSVRGELLVRLGRQCEAAAEFDRAAQLADNSRERDVLTGKAGRARAAR